MKVKPRTMTLVNPIPICEMKDGQIGILDSYKRVMLKKSGDKVMISSADKDNDYYHDEDFGKRRVFIIPFNKELQHKNWNGI